MLPASRRPWQDGAKAAQALLANAQMLEDLDTGARIGGGPGIGVRGPAAARSALLDNPRFHGPQETNALSSVADTGSWMPTHWGRQAYREAADRRGRGRSHWFAFRSGVKAGSVGARACPCGDPRSWRDGSGSGHECRQEPRCPERGSAH